MLVKASDARSWQRRMEGVGRELDAVGREAQPDPQWDGGHLALAGESGPGVGAEGLPDAPVASWTTPSVSAATGEAQPGPIGSMPGLSLASCERGGSACGLSSQRADGDVARSGAFASPVSGEEAARSQNPIPVLGVVLIPFVPSTRGSTLRTGCPGGAQPRLQMPRRWRRPVWRRGTQGCEAFPQPTDGSPQREEMAAGSPDLHQQWPCCDWTRKSLAHPL